MSVIDRIHAQIARSAVEERTSAEKSSSQEIERLHDEREGLNAAIIKGNKEAIQILDRVEEAQDQGFFADAWDWLTGDDPEAEAQEDAARKQAEIDRAAQQAALLEEKQRMELEKMSDAVGMADAAARNLDQMLVNLESLRRNVRTGGQP